MAPKQPPLVPTEEEISAAMAAYRAADVERRRLRIAHHEAGHAVVAHRLGQRLVYVTIGPHLREGESGHVELAPPVLNDEVRIQEMIVIGLAGPIAQATYTGWEQLIDWRVMGSQRYDPIFLYDGDMKKVWNLIRMVVKCRGWRERFPGYAARMMRRTHALV
jgi:hypothetical protein